MVRYMRFNCNTGPFGGPGSGDELRSKDNTWHCLPTSAKNWDGFVSCHPSPTPPRDETAIVWQRLAYLGKAWQKLRPIASHACRQGQLPLNPETDKDLRQTGVAAAIHLGGHCIIASLHPPKPACIALQRRCIAVQCSAMKCNDVSLHFIAHHCTATMQRCNDRFVHQRRQSGQIAQSARWPCA